MSAPRQSTPPTGLAIMLACLGLTAGGAAAAQAVTASPGALHDCAIISADTERLACYDRLAGRAHAAGAPAAAAPTAGAPASAAPPSASTTVATAPAAPAASAAVGAAAAATAAAPAPQSFGLYTAEHPKPPPVASSVEARVSALGTSAGGHMTVSLDSGAVWELLDQTDPLLGVGQTVTIARAALGSFLMTTPAKRQHRVRRLN